MYIVHLLIVALTLNIWGASGWHTGTFFTLGSKTVFTSMANANFAPMAYLPIKLAQQANTTLPSSRSRITATLAVTAPTLITDSNVITSLVTPTVTVTPTPPETGASNPQLILAPTPTATTQITASAEAVDPLDGTIIANRSLATATFFLEGATFTLPAERSISVDLLRITSVLNLYNCDATTPESQTNCFWDPYLLQRDGFYEIYDSGGPSEVNLLLREAGTPPNDQIWVQNRTSNVESIVYRNEIYEITPTSVQEFAVPTGMPAILYTRSCVSDGSQTSCEWTPKSLDSGIYYALEEHSSTGSLPNSRITIVELRPVVASSGEPIRATPTPVSPSGAATAPLVTVAANSLTCRLQVPVLNVRSGPGLQFQIIDKIRTVEADPASVIVVGRSQDNQWLAVADTVAQDGWITSSTNFILCDGDILALPTVQAPDLPAQLAPAPTVILPESADQAGSTADEPALPESPSDNDSVPAETSAEEGIEAVPVPAGIPSGLAQLVIHNGFQYEMRFTLDQRYRIQEGRSEYDLRPGESIAILVKPGTISFTASSPWNGLSGNAELTVNADQSQSLWLRFEPDPGEAGKWELRWQ
jgi:hypothetical protein